ncbi:hypothetical protein Cgig2_010571 [Carnegiea gigantea]|uniref:RBR-type E3 ubiquitin transferase n=1 Tax=Carnegiea gigantea TaxID=171969 RepID=A0A9Q1KS30_9CARY|nr:hypothetical protein Cgig2_010571 [Carnegiea gigantea]
MLRLEYVNQSKCSLILNLRDEIDDDWELIDVHEEEFSDAGERDIAGDGQDSDVTDLPDHLPFPSFNFPRTIKFKILSKADVLQHLEDKITLVCSIVPLSRAEAIVLLHHFKWDVDRAQDEWLEREQKVRQAVGLFERPIVATSDAAKIACGTCQEKLPGDMNNMMLAVSCGHQFCHSCWTEYVSKAIGDGPRCLALRCPHPSCGAAVGPDMVDLLSSEKDKKKFENCLLKSYLNSCEEAKWCPAPGCEYALFSSGDGDSSNVTCRCFYRFCWKHVDDGHKREIAKKSLERYNSYYQRWVTTESLPMLCEILMIPPKELDVLVEANLQIAECWQLLKWAYVYVYFLSEDECSKMPLLEFMQEQAEDLVKLLHKHVEELKHSLLQGDVPMTRLKDFRNNLVQLTRVTRNHFDKMAMALNARLPEVVFIPTPMASSMLE